MNEPGKIKCDTHGWQNEAFVCQHIVESMHTGIPVGFHWPEDSNSLHPDAWCSACEAARIQAGGDWTEEVTAQISVKLICAACYEYAKGIWSHGQKVVQ